MKRKYEDDEVLDENGVKDYLEQFFKERESRGEIRNDKRPVRRNWLLWIKNILFPPYGRKKKDKVL